MGIFYAFCRVVDDIADDPSASPDSKRHALAEWRHQIAACYEGSPTDPLAIELAPILRRYQVPREPLLEILSGVESDIHPQEFETWEELRLYCYRVASCVGLVSIEIFGYTDPRTREYAELLGLAFQTTNILRDVKTDLDNGRIYLPREDFEDPGREFERLRGGLFTEGVREAMRRMAARSEHFYEAAEKTLPPADRQSMIAAQVMRDVYRSILDRVRARDYDVWRHPARLHAVQKLWALQKAVRAHRRPAPKPYRPRRDIAVLGAGYAGLAAALSLAKQGHKVTIYEARPGLGGRAHSFFHQGHRIDNGQHLLMGCYSETLKLIDEIGACGWVRQQERLDLSFASAEAGLTHLRAAALPAPLHLAGALLGCEEFGIRDAFSAGEVVIAGLWDRAGTRWASSTVAEMLLACRQSPATIRALWEPFCLAALNEPIATASAKLFLATVRRAFAGGSQASALVMPRRSLGDLIHPAAAHLRAMGAVFHLNHPVTGLEWGADGPRRVVTAHGATPHDLVISALPWHALRRLLPPESDLAHRLKPLRGAPILSVQIWTDKPLSPEPVVGLLGSPIHWCFQHDRIADREDANEPSSVFVTSAAYQSSDIPSADDAHVSPASTDISSQQLVNLALAESHRLLPHSREAQVLHSFVYRALDATLQATPQMQPHRPGSLTDWPRLLLAGDWTRVCCWQEIGPTQACPARSRERSGADAAPPNLKPSSAKGVSQRFLTPPKAACLLGGPRAPASTLISPSAYSLSEIFD